VRLFLKNLLFTLVVPATVGVWVPFWLAPHQSAPWCLRYASIPAFTLGAILYVWSVWGFAHHGRGTPAPIDAPKHLVVRGPYAVVRNPMYMAVLLVVLGYALWSASVLVLAYGAALALMFHAFVVLYEEPTLRRMFPEDYPRYVRNVHRWWPRRCHEPSVIQVTPRVLCFHRREYLSCSYAVLRDPGVVLVDTGIDTEARDIAAALATIGKELRDVQAILLTHWHNDHSSGAAVIRAVSGARVYYHAAAAARLTRTERARGVRGFLASQLPAAGPLSHLRGLLELAPLHPVGADRFVADGDEVEGFHVLETPGHEEGHVSYFLESEGVLFTGDALAVVDDHVSFMSRVLTRDTDAARASMLRCLEVPARAICPGHRYPLLDPDPEMLAGVRRRLQGLRRWPLIGC